VRSRTVLVAILLTIAVWAAATEEEATGLFHQGVALFDDKEYARAAELFERSETLVPRWQAAYNAGFSYLQLGRCDEARRTLERLVGRDQTLRENAGVVSALAEAFFDCCLRIAPYPADAFNVAVVRVAQRRWTEAYLAFDRYFAMAPETARDETVRQVRAEIEADPYAVDDRAHQLFQRLIWAINRAEGIAQPTGGSQ
jgi:tetratricopeptide (TPR) repeat protein